MTGIDHVVSTGLASDPVASCAGEFDLMMGGVGGIVFFG